MSKQFLQSMPDEIVPATMKDQGIDVQFHWVNEHGTTAILTGGITIRATVSVLYRRIFLCSFPSPQPTPTNTNPLTTRTPSAPAPN